VKNILYSNPLDKDIIISAKISNCKNFQLYYPPIQDNDHIMRRQEKNWEIGVKVNETISLQLVFWPHKLGNHDESTFEISHEEAGNLKYIIKVFYY
jgi:hypothetical protein